MNNINNSIDIIYKDKQAMTKKIKEMIRNMKDFRTWLIDEGYKVFEEDTPEHDLYLDIKSDKEFPVATSYDNIYLYLREQTLKHGIYNRNLFEAFTEVYNEYVFYKLAKKIEAGLI